MIKSTQETSLKGLPSFEDVWFQTLLYCLLYSLDFTEKENVLTPKCLEALYLLQPLIFKLINLFSWKIFHCHS